MMVKATDPNKRLNSHWWLLCIMVALVACAPMGLVPPRTLNEQLFYAQRELEGLTRSAVTAKEQGILKGQDLINVRKGVDGAKLAIDCGRGVAAQRNLCYLLLKGRKDEPLTYLLIAHELLGQLRTQLGKE